MAPTGCSPNPAPDARPASVVPFYGTHQAGIATPAQNYLQFRSFDFVGESLADLKRLLLIWTDAAARMSVGKNVGPISTGNGPPVDIGEAIGLGPSSLTVTFGFGASLFSDNGVDRFGLAKHRPAPLVDLPAFDGDVLQAQISGGDIGVQVSADDPQVAFHAMHDLIKQAVSFATPKWLLAGSGRTGNKVSADGDVHAVVVVPCDTFPVGQAAMAGARRPRRMLVAAGRVGVIRAPRRRGQRCRRTALSWASGVQRVAACRLLDN